MSDETLPIRVALDLLLGKLYSAEGRLSRATRHLEAAVQGSTKLDDRQLLALACAALAEVYTREGRERDASQAMRRALEIGLASAPVMSILAHALDHHAEAQPDGDHSALELAVERDPADVWGYYGLGVAYLREGNPAAAINQLNRCLELNGRFVPARVQLAALHYEQGNYAACVAEYRLAIQAGGLNEDLLADLCFGLGDAYRAQGDLEPAMEAYRQAVHILETMFVVPPLQAEAGE